MKELDIEEIRDMDEKEIQRKINELQKKKTVANWDSSGNTGGFSTDTLGEELGQINRSIARCKTVLNERFQRVQN